MTTFNETVKTAQNIIEWVDSAPPKVREQQAMALIKSLATCVLNLCEVIETEARIRESA